MTIMNSDAGHLRVGQQTSAIGAAFQLYAWALPRVATGLLLVSHGAQKLFGAFGGAGLTRTADFLWGVAALFFVIGGPGSFSIDN